jgi:uncharacterized protein
MQELRMKPFIRSVFLILSVAAVSTGAFAQSTPAYVPTSEAGPHGSAPGMQVKQIDRNQDGFAEYAVIFRPGDEPYAGLTEFAAKYQIRSAHLTAIGGFSDAKLAWFDLERKMFRVNPVNQQVEVASLIGDIALLDGKPQVHMHCVVALPDGTTRGGHILDAHVAPLLEVFVTVDPEPLLKRHDVATGLSLMDPEAKP